VDVLHSRCHGRSLRYQVFIRRSGGTLARRLNFSASPTRELVNSTDLAVFAQDRFQPTSRFYVELGGRLDRDGVIDGWNMTPRAGAALLLNSSGTSVLRSGYGLLYERSPSVAGAYDDYEALLDTRFAADGVTPLGPPTLFTRITAPHLRTSRSVTWDVALDHRINKDWTVHAGVIERVGAHELILEPTTTRLGSALLLQSEGRSRYREGEISAHYTGAPSMDLNLSYVYSQ